MKRDHGPSAEGAASLHTTRWMIVMSAAQSQAQGGQSALAEIDEEIDAFCAARPAACGFIPHERIAATLTAILHAGLTIAPLSE